MSKTQPSTRPRKPPPPLRSDAQPAAAPASPGLAALHAWLDRRHDRLLAVIVLASVLVRIVYFAQLHGSPCRWQHHWDQTDMHYFDRWARAITAGDWLSAGVEYPRHDWERGIAEEYLAEHPAERAALGRAAAAQGRPAADLLWDRWYGGKRFYKEPLYPYLVGLTYRVLGPDVRWVFVWQLALGVLNNVLVYLIARRLFGPPVAAVAAALAVLCAPTLYYEMILLRETLVLSATLLLVHFTLLVVERQRWPWWLLLGLTAGLATLLKTTLAVYVAAALLALIWQFRRQGLLLAQRAGVMIAAAALCLVPAVARNLVVGAPALSLSSIGAVTFICSNAADNSQQADFYISRFTVPILVRSGGRLLPAAIDTLRTYDGAGAFLVAEWRKFAFTWHWYEAPNNSNFYYYRLHAPILSWLPVTFFLIAPLGLAGLVLAGRRARATWPLLLMIAVNLAILLAFAVMSRLRLPLIPLMIPLAALTVTSIIELAAARRWAPAGLAAGAPVLIALWTGRPLPAGTDLIRPIDYLTGYAVYYDPATEHAAAAGDFARAARVLEDSFAFEPSAVRELGPAHPATGQSQRQLAGLFAQKRIACARYLRSAGRREAAAAMSARAHALAAAAK